MDDPAASIYVLGRGVDGHWLLREGLGDIVERFASFEAALAFLSSPAMRLTGATIAISFAAKPAGQHEFTKVMRDDAERTPHAGPHSVRTLRAERAIVADRPKAGTRPRTPGRLTLGTTKGEGRAK
jgi:hypothetical protein